MNFIIGNNKLVTERIIVHKMKVNLYYHVLMLAVVAFAQQPAQFDFIPTNLSGTFYGQVQIDGTPASAED